MTRLRWDVGGGADCRCRRPFADRRSKVCDAARVLALLHTILRLSLVFAQLGCQFVRVRVAATCSG